MNSYTKRTYQEITNIYIVNRWLSKGDYSFIESYRRPMVLNSQKTYNKHTSIERLKLCTYIEVSWFSSCNGYLPLKRGFETRPLWRVPHRRYLFRFLVYGWWWWLLLNRSIIIPYTYRPDHVILIIKTVLNVVICLFWIPWITFSRYLSEEA